MHPMSESGIARVAVAMANSSSGVSGYSSSLLGGRVPPHPAVRDTIDNEVEYRVKKVTEKFSECLHIVANEPSLALFRLQEHVRKSLPKLAQSKVDLTQLKLDVQGTCHDVDYATKAVKDMHNSQEPLMSIEALIKRAIASKKRLNAQAAEKWEVLDVAADKEGPRMRRSPIPFGTSPPCSGPPPPLTISPAQVKPATSPAQMKPTSPRRVKVSSPKEIKRSPGSQPEKADEEKRPDDEETSKR